MKYWERNVYIMNVREFVRIVGLVMAGTISAKNF